jgi:hypothetical protein
VRNGTLHRDSSGKSGRIAWPVGPTVRLYSKAALRTNFALDPQHSALSSVAAQSLDLARQGWSKQDVKRFLWENFDKSKRDLRRFGKIAHEIEDKPEDAFIPSGRSPDCILLVVSGANNAGVSTVLPSMTTTPPLGAMGRAFGSGTHALALKR